MTDIAANSSAPERKPTIKELLTSAVVQQADPILSFGYIHADLGISRVTFHKYIRHQLPVIQLSERRFGVRRSDFEAWKSSRIKPAVAA